MSSGGGGTTTVVNQTPAPGADELELIALNKQLAQKQLANIDQLAPFQRELLDLSLGEVRRQTEISKARDAILTPERLASQASSEERINELTLKSLEQEGQRAARLGPVQDELLTLQLDQMRRGGVATPEQIAQIKAATDAGIESGFSDIDIATKRGIGLVEDELANSRGLRLTDSPIRSEADLVARAGVDQKAALSKNLRASEASARLNFPLAVQQLQSGINLNQQNVNAAAQQFQADLRNRAFQNRLALTGQTASTGIGLASIGNGNGALNALTQSRLAGGSSTTTRSGGDGFGLIQAGQVAGGVGGLLQGAAMFSDRRLKRDYGKVAETSEGIGLHLYHYKGEPTDAPMRLGVMADEVRKKKPEAVFRHSSGFDVVDYGGIGLKDAA